ncbi:basic membrane protein A [Paenibacillus sp. UNCCL117]|uniref:BMP family lipoprotein n=1 Tax=unclassified Paenibacillus TaxID=185978 RepID=UPI00088D77EC|nr:MULTISPECIES: BMP family ABC transporter substrate-binding protein [unclassified Paenibacillus]SDD57624.1 nucleoside-binding protein [Paenibacillus sp. cl123]SFW51149.1 basic membrane protein A [Paenibacillus sp. UNCCL117]
MKKGIISLAIVSAMMSAVVGCGSNNAAKEPAAGGSTAPAAGAKFQVGMVTDAGTIDDKSFNQGTWEGLQKAGKEFSLTTKYLKPAGTTEADYLKEIGNLYDAGFKFIATPGFKFETAVFKAQDKYKDAKFIILDGAPHAGDNKPVVKENTVAIFFAEHESGFLAGAATALQLKEGEAGFIGGMEIPAVQKFNWGFQQGVKYANEKLGTKLTIKPENVIYQGSFDNVAAGSQLAAQMFDKGVKVVFTAAGGVGVGAINEAKTRANAGKTAWIVGVDVDQFADGVYKDGKSIILTSAMKKIDHAAYDMVKAEKDGQFPGGKTLTFDAKNDGVGIPEKNPNLSDDTVAKVKDLAAKLKSGEIKVAGEKGDLIK